MGKYSAADFSLAGDKYLGRSYEEMDCQRFFEICMADVGLKMDLTGSNAWYREVMKHGWTGTPEECKAMFGSIPKGALLFILEPVSASTPAKYRNDGIGDARHIGIKTGRGQGAIHSSHSRGGVCESKFQDKTIPNGGWNRVGLYNKFTYGSAIDAILDGGSVDPEPGPDPEPTPEPTEIRAVVDTGGKGKLKTHPSKGSSALSKAGRLDEGTVVWIIEESGDWARIKYIDPRGATWYCWVVRKFLRADEDPDAPEEPDVPVDPDEPEDPDFPDDPDEPEDPESETVTITLTRADAAALRRILNMLTGRG